MSNPLFPVRTAEELFDASSVRYGLSFKSQYIHPDDPTLDPLHIHGCLEIFFNVSSNISFFVGNKLYPVKNGEILVSRANEVHVGIFNEAKVHEYFCLWIDADEGSSLFDFLRKDGVASLLSFDEQTSARLSKLFFKLNSYNNTAVSQLAKTACFLEIMTLINEATAAPDYRDSIPEDFQRVLDFIDENFTALKSVDDILKNTFMSAATLNRRFKEYVRLSPKKFLDSKKLSYAAKLLSDGASVTDACLASGFSDCSHFIALFKKQFGKTPLKYRSNKS